jgi:hypothetical protein
MKWALRGADAGGPAFAAEVRANPELARQVLTHLDKLIA